jgi:methylated-DNA-[protein]-cysteine S-methyltransferase
MTTTAAAPRHVTGETALGPVTIVADGDSVTGLYFRRHVRRPGAEALGPAVRPDSGEDLLLEAAASQLRAYLEGRLTRFDLPLRAAGDGFQKSVWALVAEIPRGETTTYGAIAERLGDRALAWQVGQAVGANPLCVFVPCHRVVGADGSLTGYAGGLERKRALLDLEQPAAGAGRLFRPGAL